MGYRIVVKGLRQKNHSCAGGQYRKSFPDTGLNSPEHIQLVEQLSLNRTFAPRKNDSLNAFQVGFLSDLHALGAQRFQHFAVFDESTLYCKYTDFHPIYLSLP